MTTQGATFHCGHCGRRYGSLDEWIRAGYAIIKADTGSASLKEIIETNPGAPVRASCRKCGWTLTLGDDELHRAMKRRRVVVPASPPNPPGSIWVGSNLIRRPP